jgi:hypothetical protein
MRTPFPAKAERVNYIVRYLEAEVSETLARGRSVLLVGTRQTGKRTLMQRWAADMTVSLVQPDVRLRSSMSLRHNGMHRRRSSCDESLGHAMPGGDDAPAPAGRGYRAGHATLPTPRARRHSHTAGAIGWGRLAMETMGLQVGKENAR